MKSYSVLLGGFFVAVGAIVAYITNLTKDPIYCAIGGGIGMIFILGGMIFLIGGFLKGGLEE